MIPSKSKFILLNFVLITLLYLNSCVTNSNATETPLVSTDLPSILPTLISSTSTNTLIPPIKLSLVPPTKLLFVRGSLEVDATSTHDLILLNLQTNETISIFDKDHEIDGQTISLSYPSITWSPDGHWVAFVGNDFSKPFWLYAYEDIYIVKVDGTELRRLTYNPRYNKRDIAWSPNGEYLLVAMGINGSDLYLIHVDSGEIAKRLTSSGNNYVATWSSDGNKIAYLEDSVLSIMDLTDETLHQIKIPSDYGILDISWSPNDEYIAFVSSSNDSKCSDISLININTEKIINLTSSEYHEISPDWSPDGSKLIFARSVLPCDEVIGKENWDIYLTDMLGEEQEIVSNIASLLTVIWSPVPNLEIGKQYTITDLGENINLRTDPTLNANVLKKLSAGEIITVLQGYVDADNYYWWKIQTEDNTEGWVAELANWYKLLNE
ncbi:MAG TPA: SH3 domain-containing protein [Anaerolineales bacterium]|mgnify:FL=1|nr:SH3 domain-containing protein [Anaerolineales bacterium]